LRQDGQYFILDRRTGQPIFAVTEATRQQVHRCRVPMAAATQPYSAVEPMTPLRFDQLTAEEQPTRLL